MLSCSRAAARQALRAAAVAHGQQAARCGVAVGIPTYHTASSIASSSRSPSTSVISSTLSHGRRRAYHPNATRDQPSEEVDVESVPAFDVKMTPDAAKDITSIQRWLRNAFPSFSFPDDMALQLITHESWDLGRSAAHNRRLAFIGRRALEFYMNVFLAQYPDNQALQTIVAIDDLLHTSKLGDHVGRALKLVEVMRWTPAVNDGQKGAKEMGLFKIRGVTVEALVGAVYHQHGAQAARHFFSAHILPNLSTFPESEADRLKDAIEEQRQEGLAFLSAMNGGGGAARQSSEVEQKTDTANIAPQRTSQPPSKNGLLGNFVRHPTSTPVTSTTSVPP